MGCVKAAERLGLKGAMWLGAERACVWVMHARRDGLEVGEEVCGAEGWGCVVWYCGWRLCGMRDVGWWCAVLVCGDGSMWTWGW